MDSLTSAVTPGRAHLNFALLCIRIASGLAFIYHGSGILFGAFGGPGPEKFAGFMHLPILIGALAGLAEFAGGIAVLTGIFTRIGAACIIIVMLGAIFLVHLPHGYDLSKGGMEYALTQLLIAIALFLTRAGDYSLTRLLPGSLRRL